MLSEEDGDCLSEGCESPTVCYGYCVPDEPVDPGECDGEVACDAEPPPCPEGTTPGITGVCWSGACIPLDECPAIPCDQVESEFMCIAQTECSPYYLGSDCVCDDNGCTCSTWTFDSCSDA